MLWSFMLFNHLLLCPILGFKILKCTKQWNNYNVENAYLWKVYCKQAKLFLNIKNLLKILCNKNYLVALSKVFKLPKKLHYN